MQSGESSIEQVERELLETRGVTVEVNRDSLGWLKVRVRWDAFIVLEAAIADHDWREALVYALRYVRHRQAMSHLDKSESE